MKITARERLNAGAALTTKEISDLAGVTTASVRQRFKLAGMTPITKSAMGRTGVWSPDDWQQVFPTLAIMIGKVGA